MQSPQGNVVSQRVDEFCWTFMSEDDILTCEYTHLYAIGQASITEPDHLISADSHTAWLDFQYSS